MMKTIRYITPNGTTFYVEATKETQERCKNLLIVGLYETNKYVNRGKIGK